MDIKMEHMKEELEPTFRSFALKKGSPVADKVIELINREDFRVASGGSTPMQVKENPHKV